VILGLVTTRPAGGGGGVSDHSLLTNLGYASAGHTGFCSLATAQTITAEKLIDSAVGLRFGHAAGPLLQGPAAGALLTLTGDLDVNGHLALGNGSTPSAAYTLTAIDTLTAHPTAALYGLIYGAKLSGTQFTYGVFGGAYGRGTPSLAFVYGLNFASYYDTPSACPQLGGILTSINSTASGVGTLTIGRGLYVFAANWAGSKPATVVGVDIDQQGAAGVGTAYGLRIADQTATTVRLLELGPATPYLRLLGNWTPAANQTPLYLSEGATPTLRQVRTKDGASIGAGDLVCVLV
jgi:hypothetical protein